MKRPLPLLVGSIVLAFALVTPVDLNGAKPKPADREDGAGKGRRIGTGRLPNNLKDAKNVRLDKTAPERDPELEQYAIFEKTAPYPKPTAAVATRLPLKLERGQRIALVGNTLLDRAGMMGFFESMVQQHHVGLDLVIRNLAWSADEVDLQPRPDNFGTLHQHLTVQRADVIFAAFGFNESFAGEAGLPAFRERLGAFVDSLRQSAFNGHAAPRIVLISPVANENVGRVKAADRNNANLEAYTRIMAEVARDRQVGFVDVFAATRDAMADPATDLTFNGCHMLESGYEVFARALFEGTFGGPAPKVDAQVRETVVEKNRQWFRRYRPLNTFYYTGGRNKEYGYLDFLPAMRNFDLMVANRERRIRDLAAGRPVSTEIDDSNVPPLPPSKESRGANEWLSPADELKAFDIDPRFEVNLFASEEQFPDIACPIQMRWDARGRLWVSCSTTYPHVYPGQEPRDKIVILEDIDGDGRADRSSVFADDVHIPLSFELGDGGVYVSEEPHLTFLKDTDGDGRADFRRIIYTGFGTEDSHHALHDFVWTPDGDLLFRESIFHNSQVETPYGPVRAKNSAWFRYRPANERLITFGNYPNTNPWGVTYDDWGNHVASHPIFASAFHATNPAYPEQHPKATGIPAYSGTAGHEFVDFPNWPEEFQGGFVKVRYKPNNRVEFHRWIEREDHFEEKYVGDIVFSRNLSFIPVDLRFGPGGAMYVCDWYNPVKGHAQYSLRDPRRDRKSGRIWRILPKGAKPVAAPRIAGATTTELVDTLKRREYRYRYWAKRELRERDPDQVEAVLNHMVSRLDPAEDRHRHHQIEAIWAYRNIGLRNTDLLREVLNCENHLARAAATRQLRYWADAMPDGIAQLRSRAEDTNGLVRLEAAIAASYLGTREALDAALLTLRQPASAHLQYAIATSLGSWNLARHWKPDDSYRSRHPELTAFLKKFGKAGSPRGGALTRTAAEAAFDNQKGLAEVKISCVPERMLYTITRFEVKGGSPVKLVFTNPDVTQHNLVIVEPGAAMEVGMAGNLMAAQKDGIRRHFIPPSNKILHHTKLLGQDQTEVLRFMAPKTPGEYPYLCTFPGHWVIMRGVMVVE